MLEARYLADAGPIGRHRFIAAGRGHYPVRRLCPVRGVSEWVLRVANGTSAGGEPANIGLGSGLEQGLWGQSAPLWHPSAVSCAAPFRARRGSVTPVLGQVPPGPACAATQGYTPRTGCVAPPTGCWTSPSPLGPPRCGCPIARTCPWPPAPGPTGAPSRPRLPNTS